MSGFERSALTRRRLLLVDDDADARHMTSVLLRAHGADVVTAASAEAALEAMQTGPFDAIVCDLSMPGMDGFELMRRVRTLAAEHGGNVAAIALTGHGTPKDRKEALAAGYDWHVTKPVAALTLVDMIDGVILGKRQP